MGAPLRRARPDATQYLQVRLPGWLKNEIIDHCESLDISMNSWMIEALRAALREGRDLPEPPPARAPLPDTADQIRAWALGERILTPCGRQDACPGTEGDTWVHSGMTFCRECEIRVD